MSLRPLAALLLVAAPALAAEPVEGPLAVLPFKNLGDSAKLEFLRAGIAETLVSDLTRSGRLPVVERAQIDRALAELAPKGSSGGEEAAAARVGRIVGARTVVVGAFQEAGPKVRISARFVAVETGLVRGAAKVTGPLDDIFGLQDQVVEALLGLPRGGASAATRRRARPAGAKTVQAYRLYAKSLATSSDADKVALLKQSLAADPGFAYAADDLAALERRMVSYAQTSQQKVDAQDHALAARADDRRLPAADRAQAAVSLVSSLLAARRYHAAADAAARFQDAPPTPDAAEAASHQLFVAQDRLHRFDLALQVGERHLQKFPAGPHFREIETRMHALVDARRARDKRRAEYAADLADKLKSAKPGVEADYAPCIAARWNNQVNELMYDSCSRYLARHATDPDPDARDHAIAARFFVILALTERGDFDKARPLADALLADSDDWDKELQELLATFPAD